MTMGSTSGGDVRPRVLVAEDDRSVRESLVLALGLEGYDVHAVGDGDTAGEQDRHECHASDERPGPSSVGGYRQTARGSPLHVLMLGAPRKQRIACV